MALIIVGGGISSNYRNGGIAWVWLSWVLGFKRLGFDVLLIDQLDRSHCVWEEGQARDYESCLNLGYFEGVMEDFGLGESAAVIGEGGEPLFGPPYEDLLELAETAELLVNVSGSLRHEPLKERARRKVHVDIDPGFAHFSLASGAALPRLAGHDLYFTVGGNTGLPGCTLPSGGISWLRTRPPVVLDSWPSSWNGSGNLFTTVGKWRGVGPHGLMEELGLTFAQKGDEFRKVIELPTRVDGTFELALRMADEDTAARELLERHGWRLVDPDAVAGDPSAFRQYVQRSGAEFSVAKGVYVDTRSGWFSDRTAHYLASGRPALVQDTGLEQTLPVGEGLLVFETLEDAVEGAKRISDDYDLHARAARSLAEEYFDSDKVLSRFLEDASSVRA